MLFHDLCIIVFVLYQVFDVPFIISLFHVQNVHGIYLYLYLYICLWDISISINIYLSMGYIYIYRYRYVYGYIG